MNDAGERGKKPRNFNEAASSWDEEPRRVRLASEVAECVKKEVAVTGEMTVLDYGCGTGLVTLCLQPLVRSITGADLSDGMLEILRGKIEASGLTNVKAVLLDPDREIFPAESFDLVDIFEDGNDVVVKAELPGMKKEDIDVNISDDVITISGEKKSEEKVEKKDYYRLERSYGSFTRTLRLPAETQTDKAKASFKDGILEVRMPKTEAALQKTKKISID
jgi:HSP20 family molecular chaperone IbpA